MPSSIESLRSAVDTALDRALDGQLERLASHHPRLGPVGDVLRGFVAGGKRVRPLLLLLGFRAAGGTRHDDAMGPALALELLHTCALVHDDVIDRAPTRRGRPTVHRRFSETHRANDWAGDADGFGEAVALLVGDIAFVYADELFLSAAEVHDPQLLLAAFGRFTALREEVMAGQYLDLDSAITRTGDRELATTVATLKSGRYSVTRPLQVGACLAGAGESLISGLQSFGDPLGRAFQVRDDLLGLFGDQDATGKSTSSDLAEGKRTLLVAEALERLDPAERDRLEAGLGRADLSPAEATQLRRLIDRCGAREAAEHFVDASVAEARTALAGLEIPDDARRLLAEMTGRLGFRVS